MSTRESIVEFWDDYIDDWRNGPSTLPPILARWFRAYQGFDDGAVDSLALPEPYIGDLAGYLNEPRMVLLTLHPGVSNPMFHHRGGIHANEIGKMGAYSAWAASSPYCRDPWEAHRGENRYMSANLRFARAWTRDPEIKNTELINFELYPWHSARHNSLLECDAGIVREFVWEPISELEVGEIWAFGRAWERVAAQLRLPLVATNRGPHSGFQSSVDSRELRLFELPSGQRLIVLWQQGYAGPPGSSDIPELRRFLESLDEYPKT